MRNWSRSLKDRQSRWLHATQRSAETGTADDGNRKSLLGGRTAQTQRRVGSETQIKPTVIGSTSLAFDLRLAS